ncbi:MAG TPA: hypothetical protein VHS32_42205 [Streptosporangiaceae bacterium]|jgi:hypothetical protein|nr:hypothetical protein [Streptosporangiaceae bacterium]HEX3312897.1 hypothetical protein [Streptosporangiaceae bacterium]
MSESETVAATQREGSLLIRGAEPADHEAIRGVVLGAHARYAGQLAPEVFSRYLADQLDLGTHASYGRLLVAEAGDGVLGFAAFYPDASVQDSGLYGNSSGVHCQPYRTGPGLAARRSGKIGAPGRLLCTMVPQSLPQARILPARATQAALTS